MLRGLRMLRRGCAGTLLALAATLAAAVDPPAFEALREQFAPANVILLDRNGAPMAELLRPDPGFRLEWTPLRSLPPEMLRTLLVAEDQRFFEHSGVDWRAFVAATWQNLWYERKRGASTLSMQLAGLLDPALHASAAHGGRRTLGQKWDQTRAAQALEARWTKEQILEAYLNLVYFRGRLQGIAAAAWGLFGKAPAQLSQSEAAILSSLLRAPNARPGMVQRRACNLMRRLQAEGDCEDLVALLTRLDEAVPRPRWRQAPELARRLPGRGGERIATTLDPVWQGAARSLLAELPNARGAGLVVLDPTAQVLAYAAGDEDVTLLEEGLPVPDLKLPFDVARALAERGLTAATLLLAAPPETPEPLPWISVRTAFGTGDRQHLALLAEAVAPAVAVPAEEWRGVAGLDGLSVDPLTAAALFRSLAQGGQWLAPRWLGGSAAGAARALLPAGAAFIVAGMLPAGDLEGCRRSLIAPIQGGGVLLAGLIGTHAVAIRVAGEDAEARAAALFESLAETPPARAACATLPQPPGDVLRQPVVFEPALEPARLEWFIRGTEVAQSRLPLHLARIIWPRPRSIVDGRAAHQDAQFRVYFEARPAFAALQWRIDGQPLGSGGRIAWVPRAGLHRLELLAADGSVLDTLEFAARGP